MNNIIEKIYRYIESNDTGEKDYFLFHKNRFSYIFNTLKDLKIDADPKLLDIGSHYLHTLLGAKEMGFNVYGTDIELFIKETKERADKLDISLKECDLSKGRIPFDDNFFDVVMLNETLEHLNFHPKKVFFEIERILKPGGDILVTTPNLLRLNNRIKFILGRSIHSDIKEEYWAGTHYREYSKDEITYLMKEAKINIEKIKYVDFNYPNMNFFIKVINKLVGLALPFSRGNLVIIGKKGK
jgi:2-polyprenyl-6-hydroxyphenyl methylase/3-demethylubiquinone-9 3-methyltransferase